MQNQPPTTSRFLPFHLGLLILGLGYLPSFGQLQSTSDLSNGEKGVLIGGPSHAPIMFNTFDFSQFDRISLGDWIDSVRRETDRVTALKSLDRQQSQGSDWQIILQFLEQASQYRELKEKHDREREEIDSEISSQEFNISVAQTRLDVARQRWRELAQRIKLVDERLPQTQSKVRILREFIQNDDSLVAFLKAHAELCSQMEEQGMAWAEMRLTNHLLEVLPEAINEKRRQLRNVQAFDEKAENGSKIERASYQDGAATQNLMVSEAGSDSEAMRSNLSPERLATIKAGIERTNSQLQEFHDDRVAMEEKVQSLVSLTESLRLKLERIGQAHGRETVLLAAHRKLPSDAEIRVQNHEVRKLIKQVNVEMLQIERVLEEEKESVAQKEGATVTNRRRAQSNETIEKTEEWLAVSNQLHDELVELSNEQDRMLSAIRDLRYFLDNKLLWVRNAEPLGPEALSNAWEGFWKLVQPDQWAQLIWGVTQNVQRQPFTMMLSLIGLIVIHWTGKRLSRRNADPQEIGIRHT